jgi:hypothetical protein
MSLNDFFGPEDDELPDFEVPAATVGQRQTAAQVLPVLAMEASFTKSTARLLEHGQGIIVLSLPHRDWSDLIVNGLRGLDKRPYVCVALEKAKKQGVLQRVGEDHLRQISDGRSVVYVSPDPAEILDQSVLAAADATVAIRPMTAALLRKLIRKVTGGIARGVTDQLAGLKLPVILACVRPDLTARQCVQRLERALGRVAPPRSSWVPPLTELPLTKPVRTWSNRMLADMRAAAAGNLPPDQLVFGLLEGPPGTGKTLIAESLARTAGWDFVPATMGGWFTTGDGALGGVARNLRVFVDDIIARAPAVGFLDELDAIPNRETMDNRGRDFWTPVVTLFLTELDRLRRCGKPVLLLGATNHYRMLDPALIRHERMQQRVSVLPPTHEEEVVELLRHYLKQDLPDTDLAKLARLGLGATPAQIKGWTAEARSVAREAGRKLSAADMREQMLPPDHRSHEDLRAIALHEAGHAVVAHYLGVTVEHITLLQDGQSGGHTRSRPSTLVLGWAGVNDQVTILLGGRAADIVLGSGPNAGAEHDLERATAMLADALDRQGLGSSLAYRPRLLPHAGHAELEAHLSRLLDRAIDIIRLDQDIALRLANRLLAQRVLSAAEIAYVLRRSEKAAVRIPHRSRPT